MGGDVTFERAMMHGAQVDLPRFLREESQRDVGSPVTTSKSEDEGALGEDDRRIVVCRTCRSLVTSSSFAIVVDGQHQHTFFNPAGMAFEIGCWSNAEGCDAFGQPTSEFTWFAGFDWSYAVCRGCGGLLGWFYSGSGSGFWGLITNRLEEEERGSEQR